MMIVLSIIYCAIIWLVFAKLKLLRLSLPLACLFASVGPIAILSMLFCIGHFHPSSSGLLTFQEVIPITPQLNQPGRVAEILVHPNEPVKKGQALFTVDKVPYENNVSQITASLAEAIQRVSIAKAAITVSESINKQARASLDLAKVTRDRQAILIESKATSQQKLDESEAAVKTAEAAVQQGEASLQQTMLSVGTASAQRDAIAAQLADAKYDLEQTTVVAPSDGLVTNLALQPGMMVGGSLGPVMTFVADRSEANKGVVVAMFEQKNYLLIEPGQYSEVILKDYPGQIFKGRVLTTIDASGAGQMPASGILPEDFDSKEPTRFAVRIKIDDANDLRIPAGSQGQAAIYTEHVQIAAVPSMIVIRIQSWLNFVF